MGAVSSREFRPLPDELIVSILLARNASLHPFCN
jgi:hypothetical protein